MSLSNKQSLFKIIEDGIKAQVIPALRESIIETLMSEHRERIEKLVDERLVDVCVLNVECLKDALMYRDELHLYINGVDVNKTIKKGG